MHANIKNSARIFAKNISESWNCDKEVQRETEETSDMMNNFHRIFLVEFGRNLQPTFSLWRTKSYFLGL